MIEFRVHAKRQQDLLEEDASLSLGWFELSVKGFTGCFFREGYCMIFLTLEALIGHLNNLSATQKGKERWVGEDHGAVIEMIRRQDVLELAISETVVHVPFSQFKEAVLKMAKDFAEQCLKTNPSIENESAFEDLVDSVRPI